jgi:hypothetical protein
MLNLVSIGLATILLAHCQLYTSSFTHPVHSKHIRNHKINNPHCTAANSKLLSTFDNVEQPKSTFSSVESSASSKQKKKDLKTFNRYLEIESWKRGPSARDLEPVLRAVGEACKQMNRIVQRAQTDDFYGVAVDESGNPLEETNVQGEVQQKLDVVCNEIMLKQFCGSSKGIIAAVASEEEDTTRYCSSVMVSRSLNEWFVMDGQKRMDGYMSP